jgi:putative PIN family toxin of toxin-antitoxin system
MKVVLDTSVLVSGFLSPFGPCGEIVRMVTAGKIQLCYDARILAEYIEVLRRPLFQIDPNELAPIIDYIESTGQPAASSPLPHRLPDKDDEMFLEVALSAGARCLVTGNMKHYPEKLRMGMRVMTPAQFMAFYRARRYD